jgi:YebC/PmpR family DNA-binding regulatory protein
MSGHSKWSSIKHKKGAADAKRGKLFSKLARAITVAARDGGDPSGNPTLATAIQKAKDASMPKDKIQKAIDVGTGADADAEAIEGVLFEGYGPGGVAVLVEALTDNRNRTTADVRNAFSKHGGSLGEPGSVAWIFEKRGVVAVDGGRYGEDDLIAAIDAGAEDVQEDGELLRVLCEPASLTAVREALEAAGVEIESADLAMEPKSTVEVKGHDAERLLKMLDALSEHDDVAEVHANF